MDTASNLPDDFPADSFAILAFCDTCDHSAPLERDRFPLGITVKALRQRLRCSACGQQGGSVRIAYTGAGGFRYGGHNSTVGPSCL